MKYASSPGEGGTHEYSLVAVQWIDAASNDGWCEIKEIEPPVYIESVGFLVRDESEFVAVANSVNEHGVACTMIIPRSVIQSVSYLDAVEGYEVR